MHFNMTKLPRAVGPITAITAMTGDHGDSVDLC
jgi:hypothetical protein